MRIKGQVLKIRACNTAQVAVLQHEWQSHECCNTATSAVLHASIFNTWPLILKYLYYLIFLFIPKKQGIFQYWPLLINTQCSRIFQCMASWSEKVLHCKIRDVHVFSNSGHALKNTWYVKYWIFSNSDLFKVDISNSEFFYLELFQFRIFPTFPFQITVIIVKK